MKSFFYILSLLSFFLIFSCKKEDIDRLPSIFQESMEVSEEKPETYFMVGPRDYDMGWIRISTIDEKQSENVIDKDIAITKEITNKEETEIEISEDEKAIIYCEKGKIKKIVFNFITVEKTGKGKYSVKLNKKPSTQDIIIYDFTFASNDGFSSAAIYINKEQNK